MSDSILIVGAGPVGLSLATALTQAGIPVAVYEQGGGIAQEIRASTFHPATMQQMAAWGVLDAVLAKGYRVDRLQFWDRVERRVVGDFDYKAIAGDTPYPFRLQCPQHVYAETLLDHLKGEPLARVHFNHELLRCEEEPGGVTALFRTEDGLTTAMGRLICGADGANSALRRWLNLGFEGMTYEDRFLLIGTDLDLNRYFQGIAPVAYIFDPDEWVIVLQLNGLLRLVFQVRPEEDSERVRDEAAVRERIRDFLGQDAVYKILHTSIYRVHQRVASTFRVGRSLLLGDAAHINNPASGMGMNSGILDAACLSEKIVAYLASGDGVHLDRYSDLRRNYALEKIRDYTKQRYQDLSARDEGERRARNDSFKAMASDPQRSREFLLKAAMLA